MRACNDWRRALTNTMRRLSTRLPLLLHAGGPASSWLALLRPPSSAALSMGRQIIFFKTQAGTKSTISKLLIFPCSSFSSMTSDERELLVCPVHLLEIVPLVNSDPDGDYEACNDCERRERLNVLAHQKREGKGDRRDRRDQGVDCKQAGRGAAVSLDRGDRRTQLLLINCLVLSPRPRDVPMAWKAADSCLTTTARV